MMMKSQWSQKLSTPSVFSLQEKGVYFIPPPYHRIPFAEAIKSPIFHYNHSFIYLYFFSSFYPSSSALSINMFKSVFALYLVLCWLSLMCFGDDDPNEAKNAELGIKCNDMSSSEYPDATYLLNNVLTKNETVVAQKGSFVVQYKTAAAVSRPSGSENTTTYAYLRTGVEAIMRHCKQDDGKINGEYTPVDKKGVYRICLTGSEETDDC